VTVFCILRFPPVEQNGKRLSFSGCFPVKLRREIINRSVLQPFARIGVKLGVSVKSGDVFFGNRLPDAERRNAVENFRFYSLYFAPDRFDKIVDVFSAPIVARSNFPPEFLYFCQFASSGNSIFAPLASFSA
jgi:hypothetical protein